MLLAELQRYANVTTATTALHMISPVNLVHVRIQLSALSMQLETSRLSTSVTRNDCFRDWDHTVIKVSGRKFFGGGGREAYLHRLYLPYTGNGIRYQYPVISESSPKNVGA